MDRAVKKGFQVLPTASYLCLHPGFNILIRRTEREKHLKMIKEKAPAKRIWNDGSSTHRRVKT